MTHTTPPQAWNHKWRKRGSASQRIVEKRKLWRIPGTSSQYHDLLSPEVNFGPILLLSKRFGGGVRHALNPGRGGLRGASQRLCTNSRMFHFHFDVTQAAPSTRSLQWASFPYTALNIQHQKLEIGRFAARLQTKMRPAVFHKTDGLTIIN